MTKTQSDFLKMNWLTVANIVLLLGVLVQQAKWQQNVENKISDFQNHIIDKEMHMPFKDKIEIFVPRFELDTRLKSIQSGIDKIDKKLSK